MIIPKRIKKGAQQPPYWEPAESWEKECGVKAVLVCPSGYQASLRKHEISTDGIVTSSCKCHSCEFHEHVMLADWNNMPKTKTKKASAPKAPKTIPAPKQGKCRAADVGHAACKCG